MHTDEIEYNQLKYIFFVSCENIIEMIPVLYTYTLKNYPGSYYKQNWQKLLLIKSNSEYQTFIKKNPYSNVESFLLFSCNWEAYKQYLFTIIINHFNWYFLIYVVHSISFQTFFCTDI